MGSTAGAANWVTWAERRHLLIRGADVKCSECGTKSWLPLGALPPPITCPGCGCLVDQPYEPQGITFTYRLGEPVRRALETDCLGHVLALSWFVQLFGELGLVGAHPGVSLARAEGGQVLGEADVLLLFADGSLVPVEVKRTVSGVDERAVQLLDSTVWVLCPIAN